MKRIVPGLLIALFVLFASGCSSMAPNYPVSIENVETLKSAGDFHAKVGDFTSINAPGNANPISLRGGSLVSPYQNSYAMYVGEAIKQEMTMAQKLSPTANVELSGVLLKNDVDAAIVTGHANIEIQIIVKKNGKIAYDRVKAVEHQWESSFAGPIAIPRATQQYPIMIQKLLASLYADKDFLNAIK
ncbi:hypothetical protein AAKU55_005334 [Oxalobacteraceae bacterium GrIS 1.11]